MTAGSIAEFEDKMAELREQCVEGIEGRLHDITAGWEEMARRIDDEQRETTIRKVHSLAGSGSLYGFDSITEAAKSLERKLVEIRNTGDLPSGEQTEEGRDRLDSLDKAIWNCIQEVRG